SSRRRHTRSDRDWSSDVCSSDLPLTAAQMTEPETLWAAVHRPDGLTLAVLTDAPARAVVSGEGVRLEGLPYGGAVCLFAAWESEIGRASCRERVEDLVDGLPMDG